MKRSIVAAVFLTAICGAFASSEPPRFLKVSDHCYFLRLPGSGENIAAVVTDQGVLLADPPSEPNLSIATEALKTLTPKPVRWVVFSNPVSERSPGARLLVERGALLLGGGQMRNSEENSGDLSGLPWMVFGHEMRLFPSNVEIRMTVLQHKAHSGADLVLYIPAEKVLFVGGLYEAARFPDIDEAAQGKAGDWIDALKEVVDSIPVLKPAIPKAKIDPVQPEKTLEEGIAVVSSRGEISNLQNMKDLLSTAQKLRAEIAKAVKGGRSCEGYLDSARAGAYRVYGNFDVYAGQLCQEIRD